MAAEASSIWCCAVCGYVHRGDGAPDLCPICGAPQDDFERQEGPPAAQAAASPSRWRCLNCQYIVDGDSPPDICPICGAPVDDFEAVADDEEEPTASECVRSVVVVGGGVAGVAAVEAVRSAAPETEIVLVSKEADLPYFRLNLTRYLAGEITGSDLIMHPETWYAEKNIDLWLGREVTEISLDAQALRFRNGEEKAWDKLILAAGSHAFVPPIPGANREGVTPLRSAQDARAILNTASGASCVVIGGGLLGLEAAGALARQGRKVMLLEGHDWLMPRQLNRRAGEILGSHVRAQGIDLRTGARTAEIPGDDRARAVELKDGTVLPAELVVVATGVRPNSYLARLAGLHVNRGIVVDDSLITSHPDVFACGDVAEHRGLVYGVWAPAQLQGTVAGRNAVGGKAEFDGVPRSNTLKVLGMPMFSIGQVEPLDASFDVVEEETGDGYVRFVLHDTHLVGAILLGDTSLTTSVKKAVEERADFSDLSKTTPTVPALMAHLRKG